MASAVSLTKKQLRDVWDALRASHPLRDDALFEVRIRKLRGIEDLRVPFSYPVSVLAGPNGCGKSTVLFACACAYEVPGRNPREFTPTSLFPSFTNQRTGEMSDPVRQTELEFHYVHRGDRISMVWRRRKSWSRSFMGRKGGKQPGREVYLRTLANLNNPSEVRGILQLGRTAFKTRTLSPELLIFAHRILPWRYRNLAVMSDRPTRDLLFADLDGTASYSEFHMSSGERSVLRLSKDISELSDALVLIDEVDRGLHPHTQAQTMLELQRSALRNRLQVIVASHSPAVIDSVPPEGRIFLDRDGGNAEVRLAPMDRDIIQRALYGQSRDQLSILCEDAVAEGVINGVLDVLNVRLGLRHGDVLVGRNTGREEFPGHINALGEFGKLRDFIVVLDGESRHLLGRIKATAEEHGQSLLPLFLPGDGPPEQWILRVLRESPQEYAAKLGLSVGDMATAISQLESVAQGAVRQQDAARTALGSFAAMLHREVPEIARIVGRVEAERNSIPEFLTGLKEQITMWRAL